MNLQRVLLISSILIASKEKGKPTERWGRKATGLRGKPMIAELPRPADPRHSIADAGSHLTIPDACWTPLQGTPGLRFKPVWPTLQP